MANATIHHQSDSSKREYIKFASVIASILLISLVLTVVFGSEGIMEWMRWFMGVFLVVFAGFKFVGYKMFVLMFAGYDIIAKRVKAYSYAYPLIELTLGILFLANLIPLVRNWALFAVMSIGSIGVFQEIYNRRSGVYCACLGNVIKLPLSTVSLVEDLSMAGMALILIL